MLPFILNCFCPTWKKPTKRHNKNIRREDTKIQGVSANQKLFSQCNGETTTCMQTFISSQSVQREGQGVILRIYSKNRNSILIKEYTWYVFEHINHSFGNQENCLPKTKLSMIPNVSLKNGSPKGQQSPQDTSKSSLNNSFEKN